MSSSLSPLLIRGLPRLLPAGLSFGAAAQGTLTSALLGGTSSSTASLMSQQQQRHVVYDVGAATNIKWHEGAVSTEAKEAIMGQRGCVIWFTGLSGSGKSTVACTLEHALAERGKVTALLDGDNVRHGLNKNLGFSAADRHENIRRIGEVSKLFSDTGLITLVSFISPYQADRDNVRARLKPGLFIEVFMKIPIEICEQRDPKGLYKKARAGQLKGFTGIDDPYEEPKNAEIVLEAIDEKGVKAKPQDMAATIIDYLERHGFIPAAAPAAKTAAAGASSS